MNDKEFERMLEKMFEFGGRPTGKLIRTNGGFLHFIEECNKAMTSSYLVTAEDVEAASDLGIRIEKGETWLR